MTAPSRRDRRRSRRRSWPRRVVHTMLAVVVAASTLMLAGVVAGHVTHQFRLAPVLSGSMSPTIPTGALVMAEPVHKTDLRVGDVLLFNAPIDGHPLVMHRIHDRSLDHGDPVFHTKGDANDAPDAWTIRVKGTQAWRVVHSAPYVGTIVGWIGKVGARMTVLVGGAGLLLMWGLSVIWGKQPVTEPGVYFESARRQRRRKRNTQRALVIAASGSALVVALATSGLAGAQFTNTPTPPAPALGSGFLGAPTDLACSWTNATTLNLTWTDPTPTFTAGFNVMRSTTQGSGYTLDGTTVTPTVTYNDLPTPVTTKQYYVTQGTRGTWTGNNSNEVASNECLRAINLVAGTSQGFSGDGGQASAAKLANPQDMAVDASGNVYIADTTNNRIRRVDASTGIITTIAGGGASTGCAFAGAATAATLSGPRGVAVDRTTGAVYIADTGNNCIRKVSGGNISNFAGGGATTACTYLGAPTGVSMSAPRGLRFDSSTGTLYITDTTRRCIRKVSGGTMSQVAGAGTGTASACTFSGAATAVILSTTVSDVDIDASGNVYIADTGSNCIRKVTAGTVSQFAGGGANTACSFAGAATAASLSAPGGMAVDSAGRVVIADTSRRCVRIVAGGNVSQVAGTGTSGSTGDNGPAVAALLNAPSDIAADGSGDLWIADTGTDRIRRVEGPV